MPVSKEFVLTKENYYSPDRPQISNSQISDYIKSPAFYKKKHIDKIIPRKVTEPMKRGSVVDHMLTQPEVTLPYMEKVLKRDAPEIFAMQKTMEDEYLVTPATWAQAMQVTRAVQESKIWTDNLGDAEFQVLLQGKLADLELCGLADRVDDLGGGKYRLIDLKVVQAQKISSPNKWYYTCLDFGYIRQLALYQHLFAVQNKIPVENVEVGHIVAAYVEEGLTDIQAFTFDNHVLQDGFDEIMDALDGLRKGDFREPQTSWKTAHKIGA